MEVNVGDKFGKLTIQEITEFKRGSTLIGHRCRCLCDCGSEILTSLSSIVRKDNYGKRSCGECEPITHPQHGHVIGNIKSPTYTVWQGMKARCTNPNNEEYMNYGGRGIKFCTRWEKFENFLEDMGERPSDMQLDRIDNEGPYCKENCRWATRKEQARNKRTNRKVKLGDEERTISELAEMSGIGWKTIEGRLNSGWSVEDAIQTPQIKKYQRCLSEDDVREIRRMHREGVPRKSIYEAFSQASRVQISLIILRKSWKHIN